MIDYIGLIEKLDDFDDVIATYVSKMLLKENLSFLDPYVAMTSTFQEVQHIINRAFIDYRKFDPEIKSNLLSTFEMAKSISDNLPRSEWEDDFVDKLICILSYSLSLRSLVDEIISLNEIDASDPGAG
jgi:hypothetical protein